MRLASKGEGSAAKYGASYGDVRGIGAVVEERRCLLHGPDVARTESEGGTNIEEAADFEFRRPKGRRDDFGDGTSGSVPSSVRAVDSGTARPVFVLAVVIS